MTATADLRAFARDIRVESLKMVHRARASHIGSSLSMADLLAVLYGEFLNVTPETATAPDRDRFILSKGHAAAALYATLALRGFFPVAELASYTASGSRLLGHASHKVPGVELSTGSLGHGLPVACGLALAARRARQAWRSVVLLSDGELDEGSNWEAALFAGHHNLENLVVIVDYNKIQSLGRVDDVLSLEPLAAKWEAFGWAARELDGHDIGAIRAALAAVPFEADRPSVLIAHTVKGAGVGFMQDLLAWHYKSPNDEQLAQALGALTEAP